MITALLLWIVGLVTFVPYGTYYLLYEAPREQYAFLIASILFWIFGYWGAVGPLLMILKVRSVFRAIESATSKQELEKALHGPDSKDVAIDLIATDNHIPRFIAAWIYQRVLRRVFERAS